MDLAFIHCRSSNEHSQTNEEVHDPMLRQSIRTEIHHGEEHAVGRTGLWVRVAGPSLTFVGDIVLLFGCLCFLPEYTFPQPKANLWGLEKSTDLGNHLFEAGAVLHALGSIMGLAGLAVAIRAAGHTGRGTVDLWVTV